MSALSRYPHLAELLGGYLHQDWEEEFGTAAEAVAAYRAGAGADDAARSREEIGRLLKRTKSEAGLAKACRALGCAFLPTGGWRRWLEEVSARLAPAEK